MFYHPALVNFTIKHYEQNVDNDEYTLVETETEKGYTEDPVGDALAKDKAGFYALLYDTTTPIAADGSTVVEIYYDRYYYLMTFDLGGGYGVEPIYARYGAPIEIGAPERPGYTFTGWNPVVPNTMPAYTDEQLANRENVYTAQWQAEDQVDVTLVFWGENADDEEYSYLGSAVTTAAPGTEFTYNPNGTGGPDIENTLICGKEEHTHTEACIQCTHTHTLDCYSAGWYGLTETDEPTGHTLTDRGNGIKTYTSQGLFQTKTHYYLELNGKWYSVIITAVYAIILGIVLAKTRIGRQIYACGSNLEAAKLSGINAVKTRMFAYCISGLSAAICGILVASRLSSAQPTAGNGYEMEAIAASVLGGISILGGEGTILNTIIGALMMGVIRNGLNLNGVNSFWQQVILGFILLIAVASQTASKGGQLEGIKRLLGLNKIKSK